MKSFNVNNGKNNIYSILGGIFGLLYLIFVTKNTDFNALGFKQFLRILSVLTIVGHLFYGKITVLVSIALGCLIALDFLVFLQNIGNDTIYWSNVSIAIFALLISSLSLAISLTYIMDKEETSILLSKILIACTLVIMLISVFIAFGHFSSFKHLEGLVDVKAFTLELYLVRTFYHLTFLAFGLWFYFSAAKDVSVEKHNDLTERLHSYKKLLDEDAINEEEYESLKQKLFDSIK